MIEFYDRKQRNIDKLLWLVSMFYKKFLNPTDNYSEYVNSLVNHVAVVQNETEFIGYFAAKKGTEYSSYSMVMLNNSIVSSIDILKQLKELWGVKGFFGTIASDNYPSLKFHATHGNVCLEELINLVDGTEFERFFHCAILCNDEDEAFEYLTDGLGKKMPKIPVPLKTLENSRRLFHKNVVPTLLKQTSILRDINKELRSLKWKELSISDFVKTH